MTNVRLFSYSQLAPGMRIEFSNDEMNTLNELIAFCARVSNPSNQNNVETSEKLIRYLSDHMHWSPFEMVSACLEIETTRDIARQFLRHRSFSFQEFSQRYADPTDDLAFTLKEARLQDHKNRQNSLHTEDDVLKSEWEAIQRQHIHESQLKYKWAVDNGIAKEQARCVLPEGNTNSKLYCNGTIRSWMHYIAIRTKHGTQLEHMDLARACANALNPVFPMINDYVVS